MSDANQKLSQRQFMQLPRVMTRNLFSDVALSVGGVHGKFQVNAEYEFGRQKPICRRRDILRKPLIKRDKKE